MKIFITRIIPEKGRELLTDAGHEVLQWHEKRELSPEELLTHCQNADALISAGPNKIDDHFLEQCVHLKAISLFSAGYDNVDIAAATTRKIPIGHTPDVLSAATADTAFLLMLAVSRKAFFQHKKIIQGAWNFNDPTANLGIELYGKTLGILGLGRIGLEMARRSAGAYHMKIIYHNRGHNPQAEQELAATRVSFEELLAQSDVLSVHCGLNEATRGLLDQKAFRQMKSSAIFINTGRGAVHNEKDLTEALQQGILWGAGLDVTNPEPMSTSNPLLDMPNVAVLPHIGSATWETREAMSLRAAQNIIAGLNGQRMPYTINPQVYG